VSQAEHENNGSSFGRSEQILKECLHNLLMVSDERLLIAAMLPMTHCCYAANEHALLPDKLWGNERKIGICQFDRAQKTKEPFRALYVQGTSGTPCSPLYV